MVSFIPCTPQVMIMLLLFISSGLQHSTDALVSQEDGQGCIISCDAWTVSDPMAADGPDFVNPVAGLAGNSALVNDILTGTIHIRFRITVAPSICPFCPNDQCTYRVTGFYYTRSGTPPYVQSFQTTRGPLVDGSYDFAPGYAPQQSGTWTINETSLNEGEGIDGFRSHISIFVEALSPCNTHSHFFDYDISFRGLGDRPVSVWPTEDPMTILSGSGVYAKYETAMWESNATVLLSITPSNNWAIAGGPFWGPQNPRQVGTYTEVEQTVYYDAALPLPPPNPSVVIKATVSDRWSLSTDSKQYDVVP